MLDYLAWRGDLTLSQHGLCENDFLILSQLSYVAFGPFIPGPGGGSVPLSEAAEALLAFDPNAEKIHQTSYLWKNNAKLLSMLPTSRRFGGMPLFAAVDVMSVQDQKQFAALSIRLADGVCISFRGTDDTVIGWKEDLNMAFESPIPAQVEASAYLARIAAETSGPLYLTGHSKGGNLAVYAAAHADESVQRRIVRTINHDGPGLDPETVLSAGYAAIRDRLSVYIPYFSIVGMLLEHEDDYIVVESDGRLIWQHDAFTWQMRGTGMLRAEGPSEASQNINHILKGWLETLDYDRRKTFIEAVFEIIAAQGDNIDLEASWPVSAQRTISALLSLEPSTRSTFYKLIGDFLAAAILGRRPARPGREEAGPPG